MGFISHRVEKRFLKAGDHIYSWRTAFIYSHHGIYMGDDKVVHFTGELLSSSSSSSSSSCIPPEGETCSACDLLDYRERTSGVIVSCLDCFLGGGSLYRYDYGVGEWFYRFRLRGGTCSTAESGPAMVVLERAENLLKTNRFGGYDLLKNNCEDFATFCKTGQPCH